jgi:hypothetical protein
MIPKHERGLPTAPSTEKPAGTPREEAQEAKQEIIAMMQEARPHSWQARAIAHVVRRYGVVLPRENELPKDYFRRQHRERGRIEAIMDRNSERSTEYATERDFSMLLIDAYTFARGKEFKQHGATPSPDILRGIVAEELKDMKILAKRNSTVIFTPPVTENPSK